MGGQSIWDIKKGERTVKKRNIGLWKRKAHRDREGKEGGKKGRK